MFLVQLIAKSKSFVSLIDVHRNLWQIQGYAAHVRTSGVSFGHCP